MNSPTDTRIRSIVIVGGGTAGWLSAAYLNRALSPETRITVIESSDVPTVGVGEATIPTLRFTFDFLGMDEKEWMAECNASFKMAIKFVNWLDGGGEHFFHTFTNRSSARRDALIMPYERPYFPDIGMGFAPMHHWLQKKLAGEEVEPFASACVPGTLLCEKQRAPRCEEHPELNPAAAYHFDAGLVAEYLKKLSKQRGVQHVVDHVEEIKQAENGFISELTTRGGQTLSADLFLDCSGFRSVLLGGKLQEPFESASSHLLCNAAVAIPSENNPERDGLNSFTTATALGAGWSWDIPLLHRNGTGYVYSSDFLDQEQAEKELREFLGPRSHAGTARHLPLRIGKLRNVWAKNCIAIGLSGSFLEPLESTSIFMTEYQLAQLVTYFPDRNFGPARTRAYNQSINDMYLDVRDFIVLHYALSRRRDTAFWRAATRDAVLTDSLRERLEFFRENLPLQECTPTPLFRTSSYAQILAGMEHLPVAGYPILEHVSKRHGEDALAALRLERRRALELLPDHYRYLRDNAERFHCKAKANLAGGSLGVTQAEADWFDQPHFATQLTARVVDTTGPVPRIHGFEVHQDLAQHFAFTDVLLLSLSGEEPDERCCRLFSRALIALTPLSVSSAPAHAGVLANMFSRNFGSSVGAAAIVLSQRAQHCLRERAQLLSWLRAESTEPPGPASPLPVEQGTPKSLLGLVGVDCRFARDAWFSHLDALSMAIAVLFDCGLKEPWQLESALFVAWSPCMLAEIGASTGAALESYPINRPRFEYVHRQ